MGMTLSAEDFAAYVAAGLNRKYGQHPVSEMGGDERLAMIGILGRLADNAADAQTALQRNFDSMLGVASECCASCRFARPHHTGKDALSCRVNGPSIGEHRWPLTRHSLWCGRYERRQGEPLPLQPPPAA